MAFTSITVTDREDVRETLRVEFLVNAPEEAEAEVLKAINDVVSQLNNQRYPQGTYSPYLDCDVRIVPENLSDDPEDIENAYSTADDQ